MEFSEVVNPHFAFPVVGVVLCAVLVFAFGFKSPVQPPSFDLIHHDDKNKKKAKPLKKKSVHSNGHTVAVESSPSPKTNAAKSSSPKAQADKAETPKAKNKKATAAAVASSSAPAKPTKQEKVKEDDGGEWTTAQPRKKKQRTKKDSDTESSPTPAPRVKEPKTSVPVQKIEKVMEELAAAEKAGAPQPPRQKKTEASPVAKKEAKTISAPSDSSDKENTPEPAKVVEEVKATSPKKTQKKSQRKESIKIIEEIADAMSEVPAEEPKDDGFQAAKTSKKKGKKAAKEAEAPAAPLAKETAPAPKQPAKEIKQVAATPKEEAPAPAASPVTFDEMGEEDWQSAKPVKRTKKKARREN